MTDTSSILRALSAGADWITLSQDIGIGPLTIWVDADPYYGRVARPTLVSVVSGDKTFIVKFVQQGADYLHVLPMNLRFDWHGGEKEVVVTMNANNLSAILSSSDTIIYSRISKVKIVDTIVSVDDTTVEYGIPRDPGAQDLFEVVLTISMPENTVYEYRSEVLTINGNTVNIIQDASGNDYIKANPDTVVVPNTGSTGEIEISSNTSYTYTIIECTTPCEDISVNPKTIILEKTGDPKTVNVTASSNVRWEVL